MQIRSAFLLCLIGCAAARSPARDLADVELALTPFTASSLDNTFFAFVGEFEGGFQVGDDSIVVVVTKSRVRLREATDVRAPRLLDSIQVRLARASGPTWAIEQRSAPVVVGQTLQPGVEIQPGSMRFSIARPAGPLEQRWLVFEIIGRLVTTGGQPGNPGSAFVHSNRNIFSQH